MVDTCLCAYGTRSESPDSTPRSTINAAQEATEYQKGSPLLLFCCPHELTQQTMLLPLLLTSLSAVSAAVCPRGFLIHPARDRIFCLSVPGAEYVDVESPYTLGVLV